MKSVGAGAFVAAWSLRREREFDFCPRGYFLRYYAARGGHEPETADRRTRSLYRLRGMISREPYLQRVTDLAMRELFYAPEEAAPPPLAIAAVRRFREEFKTMLIGDNGIGRRLPMLDEVASPALRPEKLRRELEEQLRVRCAELERGDWPRVLAIPPSHRRYFKAPLELNVGEVCCHTPAILSWQTEGVLKIVEGTAVPPAGEAAELTALLHRCHALAVPGADAGRVRSLCFDGRGKLVEFGAGLEPGRALRRLRDGFARLRSYGGGEIWREEDFPPETKNCRGCVFRPECDAEKSAAGY